MNLLTVNHLSSGYGRIPVLDGVRFHVGESEFLGVLGHNGMGKSTLLKTLMGVLPASAGEVCLQDVDITHLPAHARARLGMGYVPQGAASSRPVRAGQPALFRQGQSRPQHGRGRDPGRVSALEAPG